MDSNFGRFRVNKDNNMMLEEKGRNTIQKNKRGPTEEVMEENGYLKQTLQLLVDRAS